MISQKTLSYHRAEAPQARQGLPALVLTRTQGVFRGVHQATSKLGSSFLPASSLRTNWLLRRVVFNMQLG